MALDVSADRVYPLLSNDSAVSPMSDWNKVFLPYCSGDVFSGSRVVTYTDPQGQGADLEFHHAGHDNVLASIDMLATMFADIPRLFVGGCSAGGAGAINNYYFFRAGLNVGQGYLLNDSGPIFPDTASTSRSRPLHDRVRQAWGVDPLIAKLPGADEIFVDFGNLADALAERFPDDRLAQSYFPFPRRSELHPSRRRVGARPRSHGAMRPRYKANMQLMRRAVGRILREAAVHVPPLHPLATKVSPRPWEEPLMEITHGTWFGMFPFKDEHGRQLGEINTTPLWLREPRRPEEWLPCRYAGSRRDRLFNVVALRQVTGAWKEVLAYVSRFRELYAAHVNLTGELCPVHLYGLARVVTSIPAFVVRGPARTADGALPVRYAALFKAMGGIHMTVDHMLDSNAATTRAWTPEGLYDYIESHGLFISDEGNACGGPRKMVLELLHTAVHGRPSDPIADESDILKYGLANLRIELTMGRRDVALRPFMGKDKRSDAPYAHAFSATGLGSWAVAPPTDIVSYARLEQGVLNQLTIAAQEIVESLKRSPSSITPGVVLARHGNLSRTLQQKGWRLQIRKGRVRVRAVANARQPKNGRR